MVVFEPYRCKNLVLKNKIVMPPMCMYSAGANGLATNFHLAHYLTRAMGGAGLIIVEATGVLPEGRISDEDLGLWSDAQTGPLREIVEGLHQYGSAAAIQLNHGGRKYQGASLPLSAPSPLPLDAHSETPKELTKQEIQSIVSAFAAAARRADEAGFDAVEIHGAHGYLIHEFLSPLSNKRRDEYGGSLAARTLFLQQILQAVKEVWPANKALLLRVSASDYAEGGIAPEDMVQIINLVKPWVDIVHVSSGGLINVPLKAFPGYQVPFAETIKTECGVPTIAVGLITDISMAEEIVCNHRANLVAFGRELLRNPFFALNTALENGEAAAEIPEPYARAYHR